MEALPISESCLFSTQREMTNIIPSLKAYSQSLGRSLLHFRCGSVLKSYIPHRGREIIGTDEQHIDAVYSRDLFDILNSRATLDSPAQDTAGLSFL
jgi:hypothetical protein